MADEKVITSPVASPAAAEPAASPDGHKRKHEDLELNNAPEPLTESEPKSDGDSLNNGVQKEDNGGADECENKRPRLESNGDSVGEADGLDDFTVSPNGHQEKEKEDEPKEEESEQPESADGNEQPINEGQEPAKESSETIVGEPASVENDKTENESAAELGQQNTGVEEPSELPREGDVPVHSTEMQPGSDTKILSRRMEVPSDKVGVLIGKAGDTIRSLQDNSGAKIQITRDADADPRSTSRPVELVGTLENINKAEKLIKDVIAEADAGGSPSLVARGFNTVQAANGGEQIEIQVSFEKVGLIIGKGGETIRNLQTRSGARIQLIQQNLSDGDQSKDRIVRVTGNKKQIETAREMIKDVMSQNVRPSPLSGGYSQQGYRPRGPVASQWGPRGPHHGHFSSYDYPQRGTYPSPNSQYPPPSYGNYPPPQAPRNNFGPSWEQRPPASMHGPPQLNYNNYGQQPHPYSQTPAQPYGGHGYNEVNKYDNHAASSQHYGHMGSQPMPYAQGGGAHSGYGPQDQYGKPPPPMYNSMQQPQVPHSQPYGQPRPSQPGEVPYQGPVSAAAQSYGQNMPPQQPYPYASGAYPSSYGSVQPTSDGYSHTPAATTASASGYPPHQAVAGYGSQQPSAYPQTAPAAGYGSYPTTAQPGYAEQPAASNAAYGYQGPAADPAYGATATVQSGYVQTQPSYDQSAGGYGNAPAAAAPAAYGKSTSPQSTYPQYDSSQMYGAHR